MEILKYIFKRILAAIPILFFVSIISFFIIRLSPVDPIGELRLNPSISQETLNAEIQRLGLDKPVILQYFYWLKSFITGDLGVSTTGESVAAKIGERILNTLLLSFVVLLFTWAIAIPLGIVAAINRNKWIDKFMTIFTSIGMAIPSFFLAILFLILAVKTGLFPTGGLTSYNYPEMNGLQKILDVIHHLFLPAAVLVIISIAGLQRQMRGNMLEVLGADYIKFARAKGLSENKVIYKHALRNAINPMVTLLGFEFAGLLSGAALTEYVFQYPGLGRLVLEAVLKSDINVVMASLMLGTFMLILGNLIADILLRLVDPTIGDVK